MGGPSFRVMQYENGRMQKEMEALKEQNESLNKEVEKLTRDKAALSTLVEVLKKRIRSLQVLEVTSASRSKRPLPVGIVQPPEAKTKKLAADQLPPRPSCAPNK